MKQSFATQNFLYKLPLNLTPLITSNFSFLITNLSVISTLIKDFMAITKISVVLCMLLVLTPFIQDFAECSRMGTSQGMVHRKMFLELKRMASKNEDPTLANNEMPEDWELRRVPGGPDPLHHKGQDPKEPRIP